MAKLYSPSARGFYDRGVHGESIPADAIEITDEEWRQLLLENAGGRDIVAGSSGKPVSAERVTPPEVIRANLIAARNAALRDSDGLAARHRDELDLGKGTTLTPEQFRELLAYRVALRTLPEKPEFPACGLPAAPAFMKGAK